ncbi:MAG TPA: exopolysaccharide biosynthesis polyprenyl glycosylphosphotransferase [Vicinamibacterales bacterium]
MMTYSNVLIHMLRDLSPEASAPGLRTTAASRAERNAMHVEGRQAAAWSGRWRVCALAAGDAFALIVSGLAACALTAGVASFSDPGCSSVITLVPLFLAGYSLGGLYPGFGVSAIQLVRTLSRQTSLVFLAIAGCAYALPIVGEPPITLLVLWWGASLACVPLMRVQVSSLAAGFTWWREPVLLFGSANRVPGIVASLAKAKHLGYRPVGIVLLRGPADDPAFSSTLTLPVMDEDDAIGAARELRVRTVLVAMSGGEQKAIELQHHFRHVILVNALDSPLVEPAAVRYLGSAIGIEYRNGLLVRRNQVIKRIMDVVLGTIGLVALFPLAALAALAIVVSNGRPWWHVQVREGRGGKPFRMWKLRTMYTDADARLAAHLAADGAARTEWQREFKLSRDPRIIPRVGDLLRRWSVDEYPQFVNVIRGDMSLVGPRALPPYHLEAFTPHFRALRARVQPGMTGMWQVMSRGRGAIAGQEALDRYYIYNWSIWVDLFVLAKTVSAVLTRRGAR